MTEPDVTLTDFAVATECALFLILLRHHERRAGALKWWFTMLFSSIGAASLCGGIVHGFLLGEENTVAPMLWLVILVAMGTTALSMWAIGARLLLAPRAARWILGAAVVQFVLYGGLTLSGRREFWIGLADNLPALCFLLFALMHKYVRAHDLRLGLAAAGPLLVLIAALLQQLQFGIHPTYFSHNALYHVLQGVGLWLLFVGAVRLVQNEEAPLVQVEWVSNGIIVGDTKTP